MPSIQKALPLKIFSSSYSFSQNAKGSLESLKNIHRGNDGHLVFLFQSVPIQKGTAASQLGIDGRHPALAMGMTPSPSNLSCLTEHYIVWLCFWTLKRTLIRLTKS
jgi:hypothetical protein